MILTKKTWLIYLFFSLIFQSVCFSTEAGFENYRYNPFQYPYPEYYLKPEIVNLSNNADFDGVERIHFFGLSAVLEKNTFDEIKTKDDKQVVVLKNSKPLLLIDKTPEELMGCVLPEARMLDLDFCSSFDSSKIFFEKLFSLTPDDLKKEEYAARGNNWIVHRKGMMFKNVEKIYIYRTDGVVAFRKDIKSAKRWSLKTEIWVFPDKIAPDYLSIGFTSTDETMIQNFIMSLE